MTYAPHLIEKLNAIAAQIDAGTADPPKVQRALCLAVRFLARDVVELDTHVTGLLRREKERSLAPAPFSSFEQIFGIGPHL